MMVAPIVTVICVCLAAAAAVPAVAAESHDFCCAISSVNVQRHLNKRGFHRPLATRLQFVWQHAAACATFVAACRVAVQDTLPAGVYADPDELARLQRTSASEDRLRHSSPSCDDDEVESSWKWRILSGGVVDVEAFAGVQSANTPPSSPSLSSQLHRPRGIRLLVWPRLNCTSPSLRSAEAEVVIPIHGRYHPADYGSQHVMVTIPPPQVFVRCGLPKTSGACKCATVRLPCCQSGSAHCAYQPISVDNWAGVSLQLPVGDLADMELVLVGTVATVLAGCVLVLTAVLTSHNNEHHADDGVIDPRVKKTE